MLNDHDLNSDNLRTDLRIGVGNRNLGGSGSVIGGVTAGGVAVVTGDDGQAKVKRRWLMGDPWTDAYYFDKGDGLNS